MEQNKFDISKFGNGGVTERIESAIQRVYDNIYDPNTDGEKARKLTVEFTFKPSKNDRTLIDVTGVVKTSLQPHSAINSTMMLGVNQDGDVVGEEWNKTAMKGQIGIDGETRIANVGIIDFQTKAK